MRIAVIQHELRQTPTEDAEALCVAARAAAEQGAELLLLPEVFSLQGDENPARDLFFEEVKSLGLQLFMPQLGPGQSAYSGFFAAEEGLGELGSMALLIGDSCMDLAAIGRMLFSLPQVGVFAPRSESDLQAEAMLELALALSDSFTGLVIVVDGDGAEPGEPGHGGSAVVMFGKVVAEAESGDDVLIVDVETPVGPPEPRERLPQIPTILQQRVAHHKGEHLQVDYPADLSDGSGER